MTRPLKKYQQFLKKRKDCFVISELKIFYLTNKITRLFRNLEIKDSKHIDKINFMFSPCILTVNRFYWPTNALNYIKLRV